MSNWKCEDHPELGYMKPEDATQHLWDCHADMMEEE